MKGTVIIFANMKNLMSYERLIARVFEEKAKFWDAKYSEKSWLLTQEHFTRKECHEETTKMFE